MRFSPLVVRLGLWPPGALHVVQHERRVCKRAGFGYRFIPSEHVADALADLENADAIICSGGTWTASTFRRLRRCRLLVSCSVGVDHIDIEAAVQAGILVRNLPDICTDEVADHTFSLLLACVRKITLLDRAVREGSWNTDLLYAIPRLRGLIFGVIGLGRIGRAVAERARAFGMVVIAHDPFVESISDHLAIPLVSLETLCEKSDVVTLHVPLLESTRHLIGVRELGAMKPSAYLVNTSRGEVVDEQALIAALTSGRLRGAALDVFAEEPPQASNRLLCLPNVVLSPHVAGYSENSVEEMREKAIREVLIVLRGEAPRLVPD